MGATLDAADGDLTETNAMHGGRYEPEPELELDGVVEPALARALVSSGRGWTMGHRRTDSPGVEGAARESRLHAIVPRAPTPVQRVTVIDGGLMGP